MWLSCSVYNCAGYGEWIKYTWRHQHRSRCCGADINLRMVWKVDDLSRTSTSKTCSPISSKPSRYLCDGENESMGSRCCCRRVLLDLPVHCWCQRGAMTVVAVVWHGGIWSQRRVDGKQKTVKGCSAWKRSQWAIVTVSDLRIPDVSQAHTNQLS
jgi:hypothetical protein